MKIHASGQDYLEAVLVLQKKIGMYVPLILPGTWGQQAKYQPCSWCFERGHLGSGALRPVDSK